VAGSHEIGDWNLEDVIGGLDQDVIILAPEARRSMAARGTTRCSDPTPTTRSMEA
jgi:hypothetical protein